MASLYDLKDAYIQIQDMIENGDEGLEDLLKTINDEIEVKAENYAKVMNNMQGNIDAIDKEIERLNNRKQTLKNGIERMKQALYMNMKETGKEKFKTELFTFTIAKNGGKQPMVIQEELVPKEYQVATYSPNKELIREKLEQGEELPFARLEERGEALRIKWNLKSQKEKYLPPLNV